MVDDRNIARVEPGREILGSPIQPGHPDNAW
jgi:hypothetical protein